MCELSCLVESARFHPLQVTHDHTLRSINSLGHLLQLLSERNGLIRWEVSPFTEQSVQRCLSYVGVSGNLDVRCWRLLCFSIDSISIKVSVTSSSNGQWRHIRMRLVKLPDTTSQSWVTCDAKIYGCLDIVIMSTWWKCSLDHGRLNTAREKTQTLTWKTEHTERSIREDGPVLYRDFVETLSKMS